AIRQRRNAGVVVRRIGENDDVRLQEIAILREKRVEMRRSDFFFSHEPSPRTVDRIASMIEPISAPVPDAPIRMPSPRAPLCRTSTANTGISTVYGMPAKLARPRSRRSARIGAVRAT